MLGWTTIYSDSMLSHWYFAKDTDIQHIASVQEISPVTTNTQGGKCNVQTKLLKNSAQIGNTVT